MQKRKTDNGRTEISKTGKELPTLARSSARNYQLWKMAKNMKPEEIEFLVTKRKNSIKYENDPKEIKYLKTEIKLLEDIYRIVKRKKR